MRYKLSSFLIQIFGEKFCFQNCFTRKKKSRAILSKFNAMYSSARRINESKTVLECWFLIKKCGINYRFFKIKYVRMVFRWNETCPFCSRATKQLKFNVLLFQFRTYVPSELKICMHIIWCATFLRNFNVQSSHRLDWISFVKNLALHC